MKTVALLFCLCVFQLQAQTIDSTSVEKHLEPKLENIAWLAGTWHGEAFGGQTEEIWSKPSGGSMMASFKLINDGKVSFYELEIIREIENSLILQLKHFDGELKGWETKDETIDFPLKKLTAKQIIFDGMSFKRVSDTEMNVFVDIKNENGDVDLVQFNPSRGSNSPRLTSIYNEHLSIHTSWACPEVIDF